MSETLKEKMKRLDLSQRFVADLCGITLAHMNNIYYGRVQEDEKYIVIVYAVDKWEKQREENRKLLLYRGYTHVK